MIPTISCASRSRRRSSATCGSFPCSSTARPCRRPATCRTASRVLPAGKGSRFRPRDLRPTLRNSPPRSFRSSKNARAGPVRNGSSDEQAALGKRVGSRAPRASRRHERRRKNGRNIAHSRQYGDKQSASNELAGRPRAAGSCGRGRGSLSRAWDAAHFANQFRREDIAVSGQHNAETARHAELGSSSGPTAHPDQKNTAALVNPPAPEVTVKFNAVEAAVGRPKSSPESDAGRSTQRSDAAPPIQLHQLESEPTDLPKVGRVDTQSPTGAGGHLPACRIRGAFCSSLCQPNPSP